jgi:hypothetical protein
VELRPLVFGVCVGPSGKFESVAAAGIREVAPGAPILTRTDQRSIHAAYNSMIDEAIEVRALGLVLVHDDVRIRDAAFCQKIEPLLVDPTIGVVGVIGADNVQSIEWWWYDNHGFVEERTRIIDFGRGRFDVDVVDGVVLGLSEAALGRLRFDVESYPGFHGYDVEICSQARERGLRVVVADIEETFHDTSGRIKDRRAHLQADRLWRSKYRRGLANGLRYRRAVLDNMHEDRLAKVRRLLTK